jgi:segregation and condensation protein A
MSYHIKLSQFEGPLDLLLHLTAKAKIDLQDIFISEITEQYLAYMQEIEEVDMERASDFLNMASTLLYIKSRSLLPRKSEIEETEEDPEQELIKKLRAYKAFKDISETLKDMQDKAGMNFYKLPEELPELVSPVVWEDVQAQSLYEAFLEVLKRKKLEKPVYERVEVKRDSFSVRLQSRKILGVLKSRKSVVFAELFEGGVTPMEIAVTFLALLQLWHSDKLRVEQKKGFGEILVKCA